MKETLISRKKMQDVIKKSRGIRLAGFNADF